MIQVVQIKALFDKVTAKPLRDSELEALTSVESNRLATIFKDALAKDEGGEIGLFEVNKPPSDIGMHLDCNLLCPALFARM